MEKAKYTKQNEDWIEIEYVEDEHDEERDFQPSFWWNNRRYYLDDFLRCHNNPWVSDNFPEYIHGYEVNEYYRPLFIEIADSGDCLNVYECTYEEVVE